MATHHPITEDHERFERLVCRMADEHANSPEANRMYTVPLSMARARIIQLERRHFSVNRRDCWAIVQGKAPLGVKRMIWEHERDELVGNEERGAADHITLRHREGELFGLSEADFEVTPPSIYTLTAMNAWSNLAFDRPWLHALAASAALEVGNSAAIVSNGGGSARWARRLNEALGIPLKKQVSGAEHMEVDIEHANLLFAVAREHATTPTARQQIIDGLAESWAIDKTFKIGMALLMEAEPG